MTLTYSKYLKLDELLALQEPLSEGEAHDETLFIIIHQAYELWFKEILHELDRLQRLLQAADVARAQLTLKRVNAIMRVLIDQLDVLETMLPLDFLAFRGYLASASGFQSVQFREIEFALGHKKREVFECFAEACEARQRLANRFESPGVWDAFLEGLARSGFKVPEEELVRDHTQPITPSPGVQKLLIEIYAGSPSTVGLCEMLLDLDEGIQEWRYRHVKMVERMIGAKVGTGGTEGVGYLKATLFKPFFPDLWAIRTEFKVP